jgi:hypothetical protein
MNKKIKDTGVKTQKHKRKNGQSTDVHLLKKKSKIGKIKERPQRSKGARYALFILSILIILGLLLFFLSTDSALPVFDSF